MNYVSHIKITSLEVNKEDNSVYNVYYDLYVTVDDITKSKNFYQRHLSVNPKDFTPFEDLTEDQVMSWVKINESDIQKLLLEIEEEQKNKTYFPKLPWQS